MPGDPTPLGPFKGGLNTLLDPSAIGDDDLVDIINFDVEVDGSLKARPPIVFDPIAVSSGSRILYLGVFRLAEGVTRIASTVSKVMAMSGNTWKTIKDGTESTKAVQYKDLIYVVSDNGSEGGKYTGTVWTDIAAMPKGGSGAVFKERLFIGGGVNRDPTLSSRVWYSNATDLDAYPAPNFFDVSPGDGEYITNIIVYNDNLVIFKNDSTYVLSYDTNPGLGTVRKISPTIGATKPFCVAQNESEIYVLHGKHVYELINYNYTRINIKVKFEYDPTVPANTAFKEEKFLSIVGDRLICRYYNRVYVYHLMSQVWSRWESTRYFGPFVKDPDKSLTHAYLQYYAGSAVSPNDQVFRIKDGHNDVDTENIPCKAVTKIYSVADQARFKRLFWWGVDILSNVSVTGTVQPITATYGVTWDDLKLKSWDDLETWDSPLLVIPSIVTLVGGRARPLSTGDRHFIKFHKSLRFRQIQFTLSLVSNGMDPPPILFNFIIFVASKEKVVKQVS